MNPYDELGVDKDASKDEIRKAYRKKAHESHPDKCGQDPAATAKFQLVAQAYSVLKDDARRKQYDETGEVKQPVDETFSDLACLVLQLIEACADPETFDLNAAVLEVLKKTILTETQVAALADKSAAKLERAAKLMKKKRSNRKANFMAKALTDRAEDHRKAAVTARRKIEKVEACIVLWQSDYQYECVVVPKEFKPFFVHSTS
jgi:curved DNA-binding protein CbpA